MDCFCLRSPAGPDRGEVAAPGGAADGALLGCLRPPGAQARGGGELPAAAGGGAAGRGAAGRCGQQVSLRAAWQARRAAPRVSLSPLSPPQPGGRTAGALLGPPGGLAGDAGPRGDRQLPRPAAAAAVLPEQGGRGEDRHWALATPGPCRLQNRGPGHSGAQFSSRFPQPATPAARSGCWALSWGVGACGPRCSEGTWRCHADRWE